MGSNKRPTLARERKPAHQTLESDGQTKPFQCAPLSHSSATETRQANRPGEKNWATARSSRTCRPTALPQRLRAMGHPSLRHKLNANRCGDVGCGLIPRLDSTADDMLYPSMRMGANRRQTGAAGALSPATPSCSPASKFLAVHVSARDQGAAPRLVRLSHFQRRRGWMGPGGLWWTGGDVRPP